MARLWQCGFELNTNTDNVEFGSGGDFVSVSGTVQATTVRSGGFAFQINSLSSGVDQGGGFTFTASNSKGPFFIRYYLRIGTYPSAQNTISNIADTGAGVGQVVITLDNTGALRLKNGGGLTTIGSASSALSLNTWYRIEIKMDSTGANGTHILDARIDGTSFASASNLTVGGVNILDFGGNLFGESQTTGNWYFDDIAINDNTGSFQTSFPGVGQIIHLQPNAAGDNNAFTVQVGGTAGSSNNYTRVKEVTPDDATSYNGDAVSGDIDDFNFSNTPGSIGSSDTINCVMVGIRYRAVVAVSEAAFKARIKKTSGGTVSSSAQITPNSTSWKTNANTQPFTYPLITYQDPDSSSWTKTTLDSLQAGYTISATNTNAADITTLWVSVDSTPGVAPAVNANFLSFM